MLLYKKEHKSIFKYFCTIYKYIKARFFCKHIYKPVKNSALYFHEKCDKCGSEKGFGNFKYK